MPQRRRWSGALRAENEEEGTRRRRSKKKKKNKQNTDHPPPAPSDAAVVGARGGVGGVGVLAHAPHAARWAAAPTARRIVSTVRRAVRGSMTLGRWPAARGASRVVVVVPPVIAPRRSDGRPAVVVVVVVAARVPRLVSARSFVGATRRRPVVVVVTAARAPPVAAARVDDVASFSGWLAGPQTARILVSAPHEAPPGERVERRAPRRRRPQPALLGRRRVAVKQVVRPTTRNRRIRLVFGSVNRTGTSSSL
mmetsp:Transcript_18427/g.73632  ORF Transcript_18427/g.73632 Transcript_18427/m.73632 type:complete len:252 (-) Transcript_18427:185-940(-)